MGGDSGIDYDAPVADPIWEPEIEGMGEIGWRESTDPWCPGIEVGRAWDVWSNESGVYTVLAERVSGGSEEDHLYFNDGSGWDLLYTGPSGGMSSSTCMRHLVGTPSGVLFTWDPWVSGCSLLRIVDGTVRAEAFNVYNVFVVSDTLVYACSYHGLMQFDGEEWTRVSIDPCEGRAMWASESRVYLAESSGIVEVFGGETWDSWDTGTISTLTAIWGFSDDDVWVGTDHGELRHWNGEEWTSVSWPDMDDSPDPNSCRYEHQQIEGMWGIEGTLFFHTGKQLAMRDGVDFAVIGYWPGEYTATEGGYECRGAIEIHSIWGNAPEELFIAAWDNEQEFGECGSEYLLWWDGSEFHWF
jgi:hypothetical protein